MRLNYNGKTIGTITTNHSMSIEDCIESLEVNTEKYTEIELFSMDYLDEHSSETIDKIYVQKEWEELSEAEKSYFLNIARPVSGIDGNSVSEGACIVDFQGLSISISGSVLEGEITIEDNSVFYNPMV